MMSSSPLLDHPTLGCTLRGKTFESTTQYRNLKFASIPARWKDSIPVDTLPTSSDGIHDATRFGPSCPHKRGAQAIDLTLVGNVTLPNEEGQGESEIMDELECLHLTVTVPKIDHSKEKFNVKQELLPVLVWVHGGGLSWGSNTWPQYDIQRLIAHSTAIGKPLIGVGINYRVGALGFLASDELSSNGNFGFKDQALAMRWVRRHIRGFGGDPRNVTAAGESAGAISLSTLLCAETGPEALFDRVVLMSGDVTLRKPRGAVWHEELYWDNVKMLDLEGVRREERTERLRNMSAEDLCDRLPLTQHWCAVIDGGWFKSDVRLGMLADGNRDVHRPAWVESMVVGDTELDGTILESRLIDDPNAFSRLLTSLQQNLSPTQASTLLHTYNISPDQPPEHQVPQLLTLSSDLRFHLPAVSVHRGWKAQRSAAVQRYAFHITNPFEGNYTGLASHELDLAFLLQNFNHLLDGGRRVLAEDMAGWFVNRCVYGEMECMTKSGGEEEVVVFSVEGIRMVGVDEYDGLFRQGRGRVLDGIGADRLWVFVESWQGLRNEEGLEERGRGRVKL